MNEEPTEVKVEDLEDIEIPQELIEKVEELRKRTKIDRNIADQDVDKLAVFHFDGQNFRCELCKVVAVKYKVCLLNLMNDNPKREFQEPCCVMAVLVGYSVVISRQNDYWLFIVITLTRLKFPEVIST